VQVGRELKLPTKSINSASWAPSLMELALDDVKSVALAKIQAVKDLGRAIDYAESVAQEAKRTLVAARLTQVLLIERDSQKNQAKHCTRFRVPSLLLTRFLRADEKYFPNARAQSSMRNVAYIIKKHKDDPEVRSSQNVGFLVPPRNCSLRSLHQGDRKSQGSAHRSSTTTRSWDDIAVEACLCCRLQSHQQASAV
jgi:hypothetical protein